VDVQPALAAVVAVLALILLAVTIGCLLADRAARASAWRRIAEERRRIHAHPDDHVPPPPAH
jgi:hypothetical protein